MTAQPPPPPLQPLGQPSPYPPAPPPYGTIPPPPPARGPRRYGNLAAMALAPFFSGALYRDVARNWRGIAALYLALLLAITWAATMIKLHVGFTAFARNEFPKLAEEIPPITIKDGVVSSPVEQPYEIKDKETGKVFAVLDTTGTINSLDDTPAIILLTQNKLHYRDRSANQTRITDLSSVKSFYLDKQKVIGWMGTLSKWFFPAVYVPAVLFSFAVRLIQALIYGAIALAFASMFQVRLTFPAAMRLAVIAVTPVILLDTILGLANVNIPLWTLIGIVIAMVYLAMAVKANHEPAAMQPQPPYPQYPPMQPAPMQAAPMPPPGRPQF